MSEYTLLNVIPLPDVDFSAEDVHDIVLARTYFTRNDNTLYTARYGGDIVNELYRNLLSAENGDLIYDLPTENRIYDSDPICYVILAYFEDTGDHYESTLYKVTAYGEATEVDAVEIHDDKGDKIEAYYQDEFDLHTVIRPP